MFIMANQKIPKEVLLEYIGESEEILQRVQNNLQILEKNNYNKEVVDELYRDIHTLKGTSQLFGFVKTGHIAHVVETCLEPLRSIEHNISSSLVDVLMSTLDLLEQMVRSIIDTFEETDQYEVQSREVLFKLIEETSKNFGGEAEIDKELIELKEDLNAKIQETQNKPLTNKESKAEEVSSPIDTIPQPAITASKPSAEGKVKNAQRPVKLVENKTEKKKEKVMSKSLLSDVNEMGKPEEAQKVADSTIRVNVDLLDKLMNLVGEIVLVRNQVLQYTNTNDDLELVNLSQTLDVVTNELQNEVMKTRMQPIGSLLNKFNRVIRDLSRDLGKKIDLVLEGTETELDKTLLEAIKDPLTHIVRNSCDHGIELPDVRMEAGKPDAGKVHIRAYHEGGQVVVEINDDGKGLSRDRIAQKAVEKGIVPAQEVKTMEDSEIYNLIFSPGFSTAQQVSSVSGRGVGMDVVRTNIEKIGGNVELQSEEGKGSTIRLKIPLTLAIVPALIVKTNEEMFAIPQVKLVELVRIEKDSQNGNVIEYLQGKPVVRLRGNILSLVELGNSLKLRKESVDLSKQDNVNIIVLNAEGDQFGLVVDEVQDTADIVVKPLSNFLKTIDVYSGATIMGDGSVALILDVNGIATKANITSRNKDKDHYSRVDRQNKATDSQDFLLVKLDHAGKFSVPLSLVNRLEEFSLKDVEYSGEQPVIRYRGDILPILNLNKYLNFTEKQQETDYENFSVIVVSKRGKNYGLWVSKILDVVSHIGEIDDGIKDRKGIYGSIIQNEEVISVLDVLSILDDEMKRMNISNKEYKAADLVEKADEKKEYRILFAEDTAFFRRQVVNTLEKASYIVDAVEDGQKAYDILLAQPETYDLILTDIEMPFMNGFELGEKIRADKRFNDIPLVAITTRFKDKDIKKGKEVGFNSYLEKLNRDLLLEEISKCLRTKKAG